jgi:hypothetical protein
MSYVDDKLQNKPLREYTRICIKPIKYLSCANVKLQNKSLKRIDVKIVYSSFKDIHYYNGTNHYISKIDAYKDQTCKINWKVF